MEGCVATAGLLVRCDIVFFHQNSVLKRTARQNLIPAATLGYMLRALGLFKQKTRKMAKNLKLFEILCVLCGGQVPYSVYSVL